MKRYLFIIVFIMMTGVSANAASSDDILGVWLDENKDAMIEIHACGSNYCGRIVWLLESTYSADSTEGTPGTPILDVNNPKENLRTKPLLGSQILYDFQFAGGDVWESGKIYNSDDGRIYSGRLQLLSRQELKIRGFVGIPLFGGTTIWTRESP
ncbi:MAG: DUF2147 domain-containing protein [Nitrospirota bacterium]